MAEITIAQALQLALEHHRAGRWGEAQGLYQQILAYDPNHGEAINLLGVLAMQMRQYEAAVDLLSRASGLRPDNYEAHYNLGAALHGLGRWAEAAAAYRRALALQPDFPEAHTNLGQALRHCGQMEEAIAEYRQAVALRPRYAEVYFHLGKALCDQDRLGEAISAYRQTVACAPDAIDGYIGLANALSYNWQLDEAVAVARQAVALGPQVAGARNTLANALQTTGQLDEAIGEYRQALALEPGNEVAHSNLVYTLHLHAGYDAQAILAEHREWDRRHAARFATEAARGHDNERDPERRLRVGYVSADFRVHFTARLIDVFLAGHDRSQFEIFCYSNVDAEDQVTRRFRAYGHQWRDIAAWDDAQVAAQVRADHIDILVDLSQHTAGHRLLVFARKPAPVQVGFLGCPATSGVSAIDYRITDPYLDPPGETEADNSEKLVRLPHFTFCLPAPGREGVGELSARRNGYITFGCLNKVSKITPGVLALWGKVLKRVPDSRLLLLLMGSEVARESICGTLAAQGVESGRVNFAPRSGHEEFLRLYNRVDISLDPFPHNGHMSSCDSIWMGVPLVTLRGRTSVGRWGVSLLSNLRLGRWIAETPEQYVEIAAGLAADLGALVEWRKSLRPRLQASAIMDGPGYVRDLERIYREIWREWCAGGVRECTRQDSNLRPVD